MSNIACARCAEIEQKVRNREQRWSATPSPSRSIAVIARRACSPPRARSVARTYFGARCRRALVVRAGQLPAVAGANRVPHECRDPPAVRASCNRALFSANAVSCRRRWANKAGGAGPDSQDAAARAKHMVRYRNTWMPKAADSDRCRPDDSQCDHERSVRREHRRATSRDPQQRSGKRARSARPWSTAPAAMQ